MSRKFGTDTFNLMMRNAGAQVLSLKLRNIELSVISFISKRSTSCCASLSQRPCLRPLGKIHWRGAKSKATITLKDLPQHVFDADQTALTTENDAQAYPIMIQQARNNMEKFEDCVLLTRVGSFYEARSTFFKFHNLAKA